MELHLCLVGSQGIPGAIPQPSPLSPAHSTEAGSSVGCFHGTPAAFQRQAGQPGRNGSRGFLVHVNEMVPGREWSRQGWAHGS